MIFSGELLNPGEELLKDKRKEKGLLAVMVI